MSYNVPETRGDIPATHNISTESLGELSPEAAAIGEHFDRSTAELLRLGSLFIIDAQTYVVPSAREANDEMQRFSPFEYRLNEMGTGYIWTLQRVPQTGEVVRVERLMSPDSRLARASRALVGESVSVECIVPATLEEIDIIAQAAKTAAKFGRVRRLPSAA